MHIEIHIFPDHFGISSAAWTGEMTELTNRIHDLIIQQPIHADAYALGKTTLLANDDSGMVLATVDIRRE